MLYVDHIEAHGRLFFEMVCELDLEGIVAKRKSAAYRADREGLAVLDQDQESEVLTG